MSKISEAEDLNASLEKADEKNPPKEGDTRRVLDIIHASEAAAPHVRASLRAQALKAAGEDHALLQLVRDTFWG